MEKEFLPYAEALALKELGFNEPCFGFYDDIDDDHPVSFIRIESLCDKLKSSITLAPLYQQAFRWFREKYGYCSYIKEVTKGSYRFYIEKFDEKFFNSDIIKTYEEAELACLVKLIEIVKEK